MSNIGQNIRSRLKALGFSQSELAERAGLSQVTIHKLLSGKSASSRRLLEIANALGCDSNWLMHGEGDGGNFSLTSDTKKVPASDMVIIRVITEDAMSKQATPVSIPKETLTRSGVNANDVACVVVNGSSMGPVLPSGAEFLLTHSNTNVVDGDMYAIFHSVRLRVVVLYSLPTGGVRLRSYSSEYPDEFVEVRQRAY